MNIEFHGHIGFSLLLFPSELSNGVLAATSSKLSKPSVLVCLGGQVIEKWPLELFLSRQVTREVVAQFLSTQVAYEGVEWIPLAEFERETVHEGGEGLISLWNKMRSDPRFPLASE